MNKPLNFRDNPALMAMVRMAIAHAARGLPALDDETQQQWLMRYREAAGERTTDSVYSFAKSQFDRHFSQFRTQYPKILGQYLVSQLDRAQGRESPWPAYDAQMPDLVSDEVMARRMAIDELTRLIDVDAEEGVRAFDPLLGEALGRDFGSIRDNPLRPAVFFHALGLTWCQVAENDRDELFMFGHYAKALGPKVAAVYPAMTAVLRKALHRPRPGGLRALAAVEGKPLYERRKDPDARTRRPREEGGPLALADLDAPAAPTPLLKAIDAVARRLEPALQEASLAPQLRLELARIQMACLRRLVVNASLAKAREHPLWTLLKDLGDASAWRRIEQPLAEQDPLLMHLYLIREMLSRDRSASATPPGRDDDAPIFRHLHAQLLTLRALPRAESVSTTPPNTSPASPDTSPVPLRGSRKSALQA